MGQRFSFLSVLVLNIALLCLQGRDQLTHFYVCKLGKLSSDNKNWNKFSIKKPIDFLSLTIGKRLDCCDRRYKDVCLVIDNDITNQICTNTETGFDNQNDDEITWSIASSGMNIQI